MPGVDGAGLLREVWDRVRWTSERNSLLDAAVRHGLDGALSMAVSQLVSEGEVAEERQSSVLTLLREVTNFEGKLPAFQDWLIRHVADLRFEGKTGIYHLSRDAEG